ncbi:hypothetical protein Ciccas_011413 [Cichlidogyrus casuarinus]|uniref:Uncharacterized protein n=1 Tax=Cichlidogyrus casuarinus TaxID=1844966 RepID=A0ABD2PRZ0_9PLAT
MNNHLLNKLNKVRSCLDQVKFGGFLSFVGATSILSLVLSDVVGDRLDTIAGAPTYSHSLSLRTRCHDAVRILGDRNIHAKIPKSIIDSLGSIESQDIPSHNNNNNIAIIGSNKIGLENALILASQHGIPGFILTSTLTGDCSLKAKQFARVCRGILQKDISSSLELVSAFVGQTSGLEDFLLNAFKSKVFSLWFGGEATVSISRDKTSQNYIGGGRCSHFGLAVATEWSKIGLPSGQVSLLALATDGLDGPSAQGCGVVVTRETVPTDTINSAQEYLTAGDSYGFFLSGMSPKCQVLPPQLTGSNVMDIFGCIFENHS